MNKTVDKKDSTEDVKLKKESTVVYWCTHLQTAFTLPVYLG